MSKKYRKKKKRKEKVDTKHNEIVYENQESYFL